MRYKHHIAALMLSAALVVPAAFSFAADKVDVRVGEHPKYGRIVLDWGKAAPHKAEIKDGALVVSFENEFEADISDVPRVLDGYISRAEMSADKKSVSFTLKGAFDLKSAQYGSALVFDLVKTAGGASQKPASTGPVVPVRVGEHPDYTRIVFDWPQKTNYSVEGRGDDHTLSFAGNADLKLAPLQRNLPRWISSIDQQGGEGRTNVALKTSVPVKIKSFLSGNSVVIDITKDETGESVAAAAETPVKKEEPVTPVTKLTNSVPELTAVPEKAETDAETTAVASAEGLRADEKVVEPAATNSGLAVAEQVGPKSLIPVSDQALSQPIKEPASSLTINVANLKDGFRMIFPWESSAAMSLFERNGSYWLVFNEPVKLDFSRLSGPYKFLLIKKQQLPHPTATIARLDVREGYTPSVARTDNEWRIDFRLGEALRIQNTIDIQPQPASSAGARVFIPAVNNGNQITFADPEVGDQLITVPLYAPGWGLGARRTFAQFVVLPSMQGIGMYTRDSSVNVAVERNGVSVTATGGLQLVSEISKDDLFAGGDLTDRFGEKKDAAQLVKLDEWAMVTPREFWEQKQRLQRRVARAPQGGRNAARLGLAKFYVAHKYYADAFAVLERIRKDDPRADEDGMYRLLRGLSNLGLHHLEEAEEDLMNPIFNGMAEVAPWRAKLAAEKGDWKTASREMKLGQEALGVYSTEFQNDFNLIQAQAALEDYDVEAAMKPLERIKTSLEGAGDKEVIARREFLEGLAALKTGNIERAIGKFDQVIEIDYRPLTAHARFRRVNAMLSKEEITPDEAIEELHKISYVWRGDDLELNVLKRIGDLQIAKGDIREGLKTFREIVMTFPKHPKSRDIALEMNDIFNQLFLEGKAEEMPPIKALALYYEYRELTPLGKQGDKMIRSLADRLIKVDLLEQATQLLDHQINFRLKGYDKAMTGTKLAVVHLWNGLPQESLNVLFKTRWKALPDAVKKERLFIQARANSELGEYGEALSLLADETGRDADELRADIYWKAKNWPKSISTLEKLLRDSGANTAKELTVEQRQHLMQLAVARNLSSDQSGLSRMRQTYRKKLENTPDLTTFDLITEQTDGSEAEFRKRASAIAKVSQLESFMNGYRERLKNGEFWNTN